MQLVRHKTVTDVTLEPHKKHLFLQLLKKEGLFFTDFSVWSLSTIFQSNSFHSLSTNSARSIVEFRLDFVNKYAIKKKQILISTLLRGLYNSAYRLISNLIKL